MYKITVWDEEILQTYWIFANERKEAKQKVKKEHYNRYKKYCKIESCIKF